MARGRRRARACARRRGRHRLRARRAPRGSGPHLGESRRGAALTAPAARPAALLRRVFAEDGALAVHVPGFRRRAQQVELAETVLGAIERSGVLVAEAGTGTGKTFAYLVPALLSGGKVIVSTGTKTLQDQLFQKDIPAVRDALKVPVTVAILKGRANYVCHYHLDRAAHEGRFMSRDDVRYLPLIQAYAGNTDSGDRSGLSTVPESAGIWSYVT